MRPLSRVLLLAAAALTICAAQASADSIVYLKDGNVWLSAPDGSQARQLTTGGRWASPSQADDGTIVAYWTLNGPAWIGDPPYSNDSRRAQGA
jgi:hypothetical protein